jgi:phosphosulfolactate phosphohydrolase-like enzyme
MGSVIPFLRGAPFPPETVRAMSDAYDEVVLVVHGRAGEEASQGLDDEVVARRIIELAERGITRKEQLRDILLAELDAGSRNH